MPLGGSLARCSRVVIVSGRRGARVSPVLLPLVAWQGLRVRRTTVVLPEAGGPRTGQVGVAPTPGSPDAPLRLLVLGESTAVGMGVATHSDGLAGQLARRLADTTGRAVRWVVSGRSGATLRRIRHRLLAELPPEPAGYDLIVLLAGVNDVLSRCSPDRWTTHMTAVRDELRRHLAPDGRIVLTGVPSFADFPSLPRPLSTCLDQHARRLDARTSAFADDRVLWVSSREVMAAGTAEDRPADWFAADGFHPGKRGYAEWAAAIAARL